MDTTFIAPVCGVGDPIPSIPAFQGATLTWAIGTDCAPFVPVQQIPKIPYLAVSAANQTALAPRFWFVKIGTDANGIPQYAALVENSRGVTFFMKSHAFYAPLSMLMLAAVLVLAFVFGIVGFLIRCRSR